MRRKIITYGEYFLQFMNTLPPKVQEKINYGLMLLRTQDRISTKFVKYVQDGLYELRTEYKGNIYRVFFIFDYGNIIVLFQGFSKKSQKTPLQEIKKALTLKHNYYASVTHS